MYLKTATVFGEACPGALRRILQEMHDTSRYALANYLGALTDIDLCRSQSGAGAIANITNLACADEIARAAAEYEAMGFGDN